MVLNIGSGEDHEHAFMLDDHESHHHHHHEQKGRRKRSSEKHEANATWEHVGTWTKHGTEGCRTLSEDLWVPFEFIHTFSFPVSALFLCWGTASDPRSDWLRPLRNGSV